MKSMTFMTSELFPVEGWTQSGKCLWAMTQILISSPGLWALHRGIISHFSQHSWALHSFNKETVFSCASSQSMLRSIKACLSCNICVGFVCYDYSHDGGFCIWVSEGKWRLCLDSGTFTNVIWRRFPKPNPKPTGVDQNWVIGCK